MASLRTALALSMMVLLLKPSRVVASRLEAIPVFNIAPLNSNQSNGFL